MPIIDTQNQDSAFPRNTAADSMTHFSAAMQNMVPLILEYKRRQADAKSLGETLGVPKDQLPAGIQGLYDAPVGKVRQYSEMLGPGGLSTLLKSGNQTVPLMYDPASGKFVMGGDGAAPAGPAGAGGPDGHNAAPPVPTSLVPMRGATTKDAINALKEKPKGGLTPEQIMATAEGVKSGKIAVSQLPGFGTNSLKSAVVAELAHQGVDIASLDLDFQAKKDYLKTVNSPGFQQTYKLLKAVGPNLDTVVRLSNKIDRTQFKMLNRAQLSVMNNSGDKDVAAFAAAGIEVADQVAKILQGGGTGSATSDAKLKQANDILSGDYTPEQYAEVALTVKSLLKERDKAMSINTMQTLGGQGKIKAEPAMRFKQLIKSGKSEAQAYKAMADEGY